MHTDALIEEHPLRPFLPTNGRVLLLGSFPPPQARWSMRFFYPNFQNDMWRIMGLVFFGQRDHFVVPHRRQFNQPLVEAFCAQRGIALFDTATAVRRLRDNASDKHLEIVRPTDLAALLSPMPLCHAVVATGERAALTLHERYGCAMPRVGGHVPMEVDGRALRLFRMPSSSRAYPLALERKADAYRAMFEQVNAL
ncbi:MAG: uracil-DNA glycosylase family protein [Bacteroidales bacterium]|nr:uracil-DNA glycosylase family protein [Bacteroidales bacterium]